MRFLIDAQLPPSLASFLVSCGFEASHVYDVDLMTASDQEIWNYAGAHDMVILTKDADFAALSHLYAGPKVVWLRFGNTRKAELQERLVALLPRIIAALRAGEGLIEIL